MAHKIHGLGSAGLLVSLALIGPAAAQDPLPPVPQGVEVLTRGPVHEAFATPTAEPQATPLVAKAPPQPLNELPPEDKPDGAVIWIPGYWAWDDERNDYLWVSGVWRTPPPGKTWVPGYWRPEGSQYQWVPGFWTAAQEQTSAVEQTAVSDVTYLPAPPQAPETVAPAAPPAQDVFYVPGGWEWRGGTFVWRAGYWARVQPGYVWVASHYRWTPSGYIFIPGYWDVAVANRGVIYAPVYIRPDVVTVGYVYTPAYAIPETVVVDTLFVRPSYCHYYFGDYYGAAYRSYGFESAVVYSRRSYDPIYTYVVYEHRSDPTFVNVQINLFNARSAGTAPRPPRTLVEQNTIIQQNNVTVINQNNVVNNTIVNNTTVNKNTFVMAAPAKQVAAAQGFRTVKLAPEARAQVQQQARAVTQVTAQRRQTEVAVPKGQPIRPRTAKLTVPPAAPARPAARTATTVHPTPTQTVHPAVTHAPAPHAGPATAHPGQPAASGITPPVRQPTIPRMNPPGIGGTASHPPFTRPNGPTVGPNGVPVRPTYPPGAHPTYPPPSQHPQPKKDDKKPLPPPQHPTFPPPMP